MSDELLYSTLVFKTPSNPSQIVKREKETIYTEVKKSNLTPQSEPLPVPDEDGREEQKVLSPASCSEKAEGVSRIYRGVALSLGLLSVLLLASVVVLCIYYYKQVGVSKQLKEKTGILAQDNQMLQEKNKNVTADSEITRRENELLRKDRDSLKAILQFSNFNVDLYCPIINASTNERKCSPCPEGWTQNNLKCYYVYLLKPWKTWAESYAECLQKGANLLTIENVEEQRFVQNITKKYYDEFHGYWFGLTNRNDQWSWQNGSLLQGGFWDPRYSTHWTLKCGLTNVGYKTLNTWAAANCLMLNRYICENKAMLL